MTEELEAKLTKLAKCWHEDHDLAHDFEHILRVVHVAKTLAKQEKADLDIVTAAALFHDLVVHPKNSEKNKDSSNDSAAEACGLLCRFTDWDNDKILAVMRVIQDCSWSKGVMPGTIEGKIVQDADMLETTGALGIMRTFASGGHYKCPFYFRGDLFCANGTVKFRSCIDLFYDRLLLVKERVHTKGAKEIAEQRHEFLLAFLKQLTKEYFQTGVLE